MVQEAWSFRSLVASRGEAVVSICIASFLSCLLVAAVIHEPVPRVQDEFSYALMSNTFSTGRIFTAAPALPEFFDTFHVLIHPVYASKYFPGQGLFLALGEKVSGHPAVGIWLSAALACAAVCWMLQAWIGPSWAFLGASIVVLQFGIFSYWSQSYWGGWGAALGGALFFGAARRLWDRISWPSSLLLATGIVILTNTRPTEGLLAILPLSSLLVMKFYRERQWKQASFGKAFILTGLLVLIPAFIATGSYDRAITGHAGKPPYVLHEEQYQESPQFTFIQLRSRIAYSSDWVRNYYEVNEMKLYMSQRTPLDLIITAAPKLTEWWEFYCGILLSIPLVIPGLLRRDWVRYAQFAVIAGFTFVALTYVQRSIPLRVVIDVLAIVQIVLLWKVFDEFWSRIAIATSVLILFESMFVKWGRPHYFAPAACLIFFLQTEGLRRIWHHSPAVDEKENISRSERRRAARESAKCARSAWQWRLIVGTLPIVCFLSLVLNVLGRRFEWFDESKESGATRHVLPMHDWSLRRAELEKWLTGQPSPQLVFVRYSPNHNVNFEWVYNHADIMHSQVIWARDLGTEHNKLLLDLLSDRTVWLLEADRPQPQLELYAQPRVAAVSSGPTAVFKKEYIGW